MNCHVGRNKLSLTGSQFAVLEWVAAGCPAGVYEQGYAHRITARALESRGLVTITGRGASWAAAITVAGTEFLAATDVPEPEPELSEAEGLLARVLAEGRIEFDRDTDSTNYDTLVAQSLRVPARPLGKKLEIVHVGTWWGTERVIRFTEHFPDRVDARPVPVVQRVREYHPAVAAFLKNKNWQYVSTEQLTRAGHILQAIAAEAGRRGWDVLGLADVTKRVPESRRRDVNKGHLAVVIDDTAFGIDLREKAKPGAAKLPPRNYSAPPRLPQWQENRNYEFLPSGVLELSIHGRSGGNRRSTFRDAKSTKVEDLLPDVFREIEIRVLEVDWQRQEAERKEASKKVRWEAAMEQARADFHEAQRSQELREQLAAWQESRDLGEYLQQMAETVARVDEEQARVAAEEWLGWAHRYAERVNPLRYVLRMPELRKPAPDDLKPFLNGWNPYGPDR